MVPLKSLAQGVARWKHFYTSNLPVSLVTQEIVAIS